MRVKDCFLAEQLVQQHVTWGKNKQKYIYLTLGSQLFWIVIVPWRFAVVLFPVSALSVSLSVVPKRHRVYTGFQVDILGHDVQGIPSGLLSNTTSVKTVLLTVLSMIYAWIISAIDTIFGKKLTTFLRLCSKWQTEKNRTPEKNRTMQYAMVLTWTLWALLTCMLLYDGKVWFFQPWKSNSPISQSSPWLLFFHCSQWGFGGFQELLCPPSIFVKNSTISSFISSSSFRVLLLLFCMDSSLFPCLSLAELRLVVPEGLL